MLLEQAIIEVLKKHSGKERTRDTKPLKCTEITKYLIHDFPDEHTADVREKSVQDDLLCCRKFIWQAKDDD